MNKYSTGQTSTAPNNQVEQHTQVQYHTNKYSTRRTSTAEQEDGKCLHPPLSRVSQQRSGAPQEGAGVLCADRYPVFVFMIIQYFSISLFQYFSISDQGGGLVRWQISSICLHDHHSVFHPWWWYSTVSISNFSSNLLKNTMCCAHNWQRIYGFLLEEKGHPPSLSVVWRADDNWFDFQQKRLMSNLQQHRIILQIGLLLSVIIRSLLIIEFFLKGFGFCEGPSIRQVFLNDM